MNGLRLRGRTCLATRLLSCVHGCRGGVETDAAPSHLQTAVGVLMSGLQQLDDEAFADRTRHRLPLAPQPSSGAWADVTA